jgi:hypothetical protein
MNTPCSRNSDDQTSKDADKIITQSGRRQYWLKLCEDAVRQSPKMTCRELAHTSGIPLEIMHKRLPESLIVVKGDKVRCMLSGFKATVWIMK